MFSPISKSRLACTTETPRSLTSHTADIFGDGESERLVGKFSADHGARDEIILATKFGFNGSSSPLTASQARGGNPHAGRAGARNIHRALDASLKRLGTDYVDLYWMHVWDGVTLIEEIVQTLGDLVRTGKIRYYGLSDMSDRLAMKAATIAAERRVPGPIATRSAPCRSTPPWRCRSS